ncbi:MAG TPA: hypothetical protein VKU41_15525, partial [Polyangiaceae bacterium]|nr:hypothetical protein [Polyangiaceae bacterium]
APTSARCFVETERTAAARAFNGDPGQPSESWWRAARDAKHPPAELRPLLTGKATTVEVAPKRARELRAWCATLAGVGSHAC